MGTIPKLDEIEEYERELRRAHAENRAPSMRDPYEVYVDYVGNTDSHVEYLSDAEQKKADSELHKNRREQLAADKKQVKTIRDSAQRLPDSETSSVLPYQAPDAKRYQGPKNKQESEALDNAVESAYDRARKFDDAGSDANIPNLTDDGQVTGDSVNLVFTRKMTTFDKPELVRENEANTVPVPVKFRTENPPQVIQQSNPVTGEAPTPETSGYVEGYVSNPAILEADGETITPTVPEDAEVFETAPYPGDVPHTAITTPYPNNVIGDETGTTREPSRENVSDVTEPLEQE